MLVAEVQVGGWFIQDEQLRLLGEGCGDEHQLPLPAGDIGIGLVPQVSDAEKVQVFPGQLFVLGTGRGEVANPGCASHHHHIQHPEGEDRHMGLGDIGDLLGQLAGAVGGQIPPIQQHPAPPPLLPGDTLEQGALPRAVLPQDAEDLRPLAGEGDVLEDVPSLLVVKAQLLYLQAHHQLTFFR